MTDQRHRRSRRRYRGSRARRTGVLPSAPHAYTLHDRALAWPLLNRALGRLLQQPRALQIAGIVVGLALIVLTVRPLIWPTMRQQMPVNDTAVQYDPARAPPALAEQPAPEESDADVLSVVAAYNQASITAAIVGRADVMAPYLASDSAAWAEVQAEYRRRATRGETHDPALTHWGVLRIVVDSDTATVETQEQWDDMTSVGGQVVSSKRGILTRNTYTLRRAPPLNRWLITDVTTTTIINWGPYANARRSTSARCGSYRPRGPVRAPRCADPPSHGPAHKRPRVRRGSMPRHLPEGSAELAESPAGWQCACLALPNRAPYRVRPSASEASHDDYAAAGG